MPRDATSFRKHNRGMAPRQARHAAHIANAILKRTDNEGMAIATANRLGMHERASGGNLSTHTAPVSLNRPWFTEPESAALGRPTTGFLKGSTPGRADAIHTHAPSGSYVFPADVVSAAGEGNSMAGAQALQSLLKLGPYGTSVPPMRAGVRMPGRAAGGGAPQETTQVALSDGELVATPEEMIALGDGDLKRGHKIADALVLELRRRNVAKLRKLPPPVGSKRSRK